MTKSSNYQTEIQKASTLESTHSRFEDIYVCNHVAKLSVRMEAKLKKFF